MSAGLGDLTNIPRTPSRPKGHSTTPPFSPTGKPCPLPYSPAIIVVAGLQLLALSGGSAGQSRSRVGLTTYTASIGVAHQARGFLIRAGRSVARRTGTVERFAELEAVLNPMLRRDLRDTVAAEAVLAAVLRPDSHVIDAGANMGAILAHMVRLAPEGRHLAYEPIPHHARELAARFPDVTVRQAALSDEAGTSNFHHVVNHSAYSGLRLRDDIPGNVGPVEQITVDVVRLDDDLPEGFRPAVIKVDVEGAEVKLFRGAMKTLTEFAPVLLFEHGRSDLYGTTSDELWDMLTQCGYRIFNSEGAGPYTREQLRIPAPEWNYMAIRST